MLRTILNYITTDKDLITIGDVSARNHNLAKRIRYNQTHHHETQLRTLIFDMLTTVRYLMISFKYEVEDIYPMVTGKDNLLLQAIIVHLENTATKQSKRDLALRKQIAHN